MLRPQVDAAAVMQPGWQRWWGQEGGQCQTRGQPSKDSPFEGAAMIGISAMV